jgi:hypothetical protein
MRIGVLMRLLHKVRGLGVEVSDVAVLTGCWMLGGCAERQTHHTDLILQKRSYRHRRRERGHAHHGRDGAGRTQAGVSFQDNRASGAHRSWA